MSEDIQALREQIDEVDGKLAALSARRMELAETIALYKRRHRLPIFDGERERQVLSRAAALYPQRDPAFVQALAVFFQTLMDLSRERQERWLGEKPAPGEAK